MRGRLKKYYGIKIVDIFIRINCSSESIWRLINVFEMNSPVLEVLYVEEVLQKALLSELKGLTLEPKVIPRKRSSTIDVVCKAPIEKLSKIISSFQEYNFECVRFSDAESNELYDNISFYSGENGSKIVKRKVANVVITVFPDESEIHIALSKEKHNVKDITCKIEDVLSEIDCQ